VISLANEDDNHDEYTDERALIARPSMLSSAEKDEVERLRSYRWFDDVNRERALALGRNAELAAGTGAACDWQSFRDEMLSIYYYDQAYRACKLDKTLHPRPTNSLTDSIYIRDSDSVDSLRRDFRLELRPLTWTGSSPEAAIKRVHDINQQAPPDGFFMLDHVVHRPWANPSDRLAMPPPFGATVYVCYGCWIIEVARWWNGNVDPERVGSCGSPLFADKWRAQKFVRALQNAAGRSPQARNSGWYGSY
jgi:hypothetical protein